MFFWDIYEIFRTGFTRNTCECWLLQLVVERQLEKQLEKHSSTKSIRGYYQKHDQFITTKMMYIFRTSASLNEL